MPKMTGCNGQADKFKPLQALHEIADFHVQSVGHDLEGLNRDVGLPAALDLTNVCAIQARTCRQRHPVTILLLQTQLADSSTDLLLNILHLQQFGDSLVLSIQVITCEVRTHEATVFVGAIRVLCVQSINVEWASLWHEY